jgi:hypothetical protein
VVRHHGDAGAIKQAADGVQIGPARSDEAQERQGGKKQRDRQNVTQPGLHRVLSHRKPQ